MTEDEVYKRARNRMEEIKGFYIHLFAYIVVNIGLFVINYLSSPQYWWFVWPLLGWGIGLVSHALSIFVFHGFLGHEWEESQIKKYIGRDKRKQKS